MSTLIDITTEEEWQKHTESLPSSTLQIINFHVRLLIHRPLIRPPQTLANATNTRHHGRHHARKCKTRHIHRHQPLSATLAPLQFPPVAHIIRQPY